MDSRVVKFPKKPVRQIPANESANDSAAQFSAPSKILAALKFVLRAVLFLIYMVMFWLRGLIVGACSLLSVIFLFLWLFAMYAFPEKNHMVWAFGITSFTSFVIMWGYDFVLAKLSPVPLVNTI